MEGMESKSIAQRIDEIEVTMKKILKEYRTAENNPIFALRDGAVALLIPRRLLKKKRISSRYVVVHPRNRYGDGLVPKHCHVLVDNFSIHGFSLIEIGHPLAIEVPPKGHKRYVEIVDFNMKMVADALGQLPPIAEDDFIVMTVAKNHSSQASRCVLLAVPHDNDKITENGKLSLRKMEARRPEYAYAIKQGFEWEAISVDPIREELSMSLA